MPSGSKHWNWRGGRKLHSKGYVGLLQRDGYDFEHRITMSKMLGRPLKDHETVHHINGVKDDNRECNLELWTIPPTSGQRVRDLIKFVVHEYPKAVKNELAKLR